jgi:hypothetical protein
MTWMKFIYWLCGGYALYYIVNILWDLARTKKVVGTKVQELTFAEAVQPQVVATAQKPEQQKPAVIDSGGVRLKQLFNLAKAESIVYTGAVTY